MESTKGEVPLPTQEKNFQTCKGFLSPLHRGISWGGWICCSGHSRRPQVFLNEESEQLRTAVPKDKISSLTAEEPSYKFRSELRVFLKWTLQRQLIGDTWLGKTEIWWLCSLIFFLFFSFFSSAFYINFSAFLIHL